MSDVRLFTLSEKRSLGDVGVIEWTPGKWWAVQVTNADGSFTPLYEAKSRADAEKWVEREQFFHDVFVTALEGGIGYWSAAEEYHWSQGDSTIPDLTGFRAVVIDNVMYAETDGETTSKYTIDRETIRRGIEGLAAGTVTWGGRTLDKKAQAFYAGVLVTQDGGEVDSSAADNIVQAGLFGDVRYG